MIIPSWLIEVTVFSFNWNCCNGLISPVKALSIFILCAVHIFQNSSYALSAVFLKLKCLFRTPCSFLFKKTWQMQLAFSCLGFQEICCEIFRKKMRSFNFLRVLILFCLFNVLHWMKLWRSCKIYEGLNLVALFGSPAPNEEVAKLKFSASSVIVNYTTNDERRD